MRDRAAAERAGRRAESVAALFLMLGGWRILARRRRVAAMEVDLIARRGRTIALVEVKQRATLEAAVLALSPQALERLKRAAGQVAAEAAARGAAADVRVDLLALAPGRWPRHIPGVG
jgi:putative endonuclease